MPSGSPVLVENVVGLKATLDYILERLGSVAGGGITQITGAITAGPGSGSQPATITATGVVAGTYGDAVTVPRLTILPSGQISFAAGVAISIPVGGITELTGPVTAGPGSGSVASVITPTGVSAATYGDGDNVAQIAINAAGQVTSASNVPIVTTRELKSDTVSATNYLGHAPSGSATSASVWIIHRLIVAADGSITSNLTATLVKWDDRLTATYT